MWPVDDIHRDEIFHCVSYIYYAILIRNKTNKKQKEQNQGNRVNWMTSDQQNQWEVEQDQGQKNVKAVTTEFIKNGVS